VRSLDFRSEGVGVITLLFSRRDIHGYNVPSNYNRKFLCVLSSTNKIIVICTKVHLQMEINCKTHFWFL
jgi:hypothetical protein